MGIKFEICPKCKCAILPSWAECKTCKSQEEAISSRRWCPKCSKSMEYFGVGRWKCWAKDCKHEIQEEKMCDVCKERKADRYIIMSTYDGGSKDWCYICSLKDDIKVAKMWADKLPIFEKQLLDELAKEGK